MSLSEENGSDWGVGSLQHLIEAHVSDYENLTDILYEFTKNQQDAQQSAGTSHRDIFQEFLYDRKIILVYGEGLGLDSKDLLRIKQNIALSNKGLDRHGLGMFGFIRLAQKLVMVSQKQKKRYILSVKAENNRVFSDIYGERDANGKNTGVREVSDREDCEYREFYDKLNRFHGNDATIVILEGVGKYKSDKFDFTFNFEKEFELKKYMRESQAKNKLYLKMYHHHIKTNKSKDWRSILYKPGHGTKLSFEVPSKEIPAEDIPGKGHDVFRVLQPDGSYLDFQLKVRFEFWVGQSNDGEICIGEKGMDYIPLKKAIMSSFKLPFDSVYVNPEYLSHVTGSIDLQIIPLDNKSKLNIFTGTRTSLSMPEGLRLCLYNILYHVNRIKLQPAVEERITKTKTKQDERDVEQVQKLLDNFRSDNRSLFEDFAHTQSSGNVQTTKVRCPTCGLTVDPIRGGKKSSIVLQTGNIYAPEDQQIYMCGSCSKHWERRSYTRSTDGNKTPVTPIAHEPAPGDGISRRRLRGFGFKYQIGPFIEGDSRRVKSIADSVIVNVRHPDYLSLKKKKDQLYLYSSLNALKEYLRHETEQSIDGPFKQSDFVIYDRRNEDLVSKFLVWFNQIDRRELADLSMEEKPVDVQKAAADLREHFGCNKK